MAEAVLNAVYTVESKLADLSIKNGQLIFISDTNQICLDFNNKRTIYDQIVTLESENERTSILAPSDLFYFVKETGVLWRYTSGDWIQLTTNPAINIVYADNKSDFPSNGKGYVLYISTQSNMIYRWDSVSHTYNSMGVSKSELEQTVNDLKNYVDEKIIEVETFSNLPNAGKTGTIYIVKGENKTYRWDDTNIKYYCIGSDYNDITLIDANN